MPVWTRINLRKLQEAFHKDLADAWRRQRERAPDDTPYAFVLYGVEDTPEFTAHVLTEEGLTRVAERYVDEGMHETLEEAREDLRYSVPDSPMFAKSLETLPSVATLFQPVASRLGETAGYKLLAEAAIEALKDLDKEGVFGAKRQRERLLLACITEDTDVDWTDKSAKALNSSAAYKRFQKHYQVAGPFASCQSIAFSTDGTSVYFCGSRGSKESNDDKSDAQLVACELRGLQAKRKWDYRFLMFGDSLREATFDATSETVLLVRATYRDSHCVSTLMRFPKNRPQPIATSQVTAEPNQLAVSQDGSRITLTSHAKSVLVFNSDLECLAEHKVGFRVHRPLWLTKNRLLIASDKGVLDFDPETGEYEELTDSPAYHISTDTGESLLGVSRWYGRSHPKKPFGFDMYRFPSMKLLQKFEPQDCETVLHAIRGDGRIVACGARDTTSMRAWVIVFDVKTGKEIGRRKESNVNDLAFLPNRSVLAIGRSDFYKENREPIEFWSLADEQ